MKKFVLLPLSIVLVFILLGVTYAKPKNVIHMSASWSKHYESIADMVAHADLVIVGKVVASRQEQRHDLIFTMQSVKIIDCLLGEYNKMIRLICCRQADLLEKRLPLNLPRIRS